MEINQMKYFLEVCNCGSMAKAAEKLNITQQGISIALRRLESELGCNLFYHKSKGLVLTQFGSAFRNEAELVLTHVDNIYSMCRAYKENNKAHIKVALTLNRFTKLPPQLQQLLMLPPEDYAIELHNEYASVCADMVKTGTRCSALSTAISAIQNLTLCCWRMCSRCSLLTGSIRMLRAMRSRSRILTACRC